MANKKDIIGGKVIASGGFGCIFDPVLKCENSNIRENKKVTKLMTIKHAKDEYYLIQKFKKILQVIPNYQKYFLLNDFTLCKPSKLTKEDLKKYKKCKALTKKNIKSKNINNSLNQLLALNMPNGGVDIDKFLEDNFVSSTLINLNNSLIQLLLNGILPMNKLNVFHCDIKEANVLVNETTFDTRLIDWGLSIIKTNTNAIPRNLYRRPFQFNVPFSSVIFNNEFINKYNIFLNTNPNPDYFQIREFVINYIFIWNEIRGPGHLNAINNIVSSLTIWELPAIKNKKIKNHIVEYDFTYYYIIEYISKILEKYTVNNVVNIMDYFNTIFLKNIDIWGFTMIYISIFEILYKDFDTLNEYQMQFINKIKYIIIHFLYENPTNLIDVVSLVEELKNLNTIFEKFGINTMSTKLQYLQEIGGNNKKTTNNKTRKIKTL